jgi:hypothetical protein
MSTECQQLIVADIHLSGVKQHGCISITLRVKLLKRQQIATTSYQSTAPQPQATVFADRGGGGNVPIHSASNSPNNSATFPSPSCSHG